MSFVNTHKHVCWICTRGWIGGVQGIHILCVFRDTSDIFLRLHNKRLSRPPNGLTFECWFCASSNTNLCRRASALPTLASFCYKNLPQFYKQNMVV